MKIKFCNSFLLFFLLGFFAVTIIACNTPPAAEQEIPQVELPVFEEAPLLVLPTDETEEKPEDSPPLPILHEAPTEEIIPERPQLDPPDHPQLNPPPEQSESVVIVPALPEPPSIIIAQPEPKIIPDPDLGNELLPEIIVAEEIPTPVEVIAEVQPAPSVEPSAPPPRETPPAPPAFIRTPEPIPPAQEQPPPVVYDIPDSPISHPNLEEDRISFSRIVRAVVGQLIEIPFRGTGWVYLGEMGSRRGVTYDSRRLDPEGQTLIFRAEIAGIYILRFNRQDFIRDLVFNDYVQVIVGDAPAASSVPGWFSPPLDQSRIVAEPRWPLTDNPGGAPSVPYTSGAEPFAAEPSAAESVAQMGETDSIFIYNPEFFSETTENETQPDRPAIIVLPYDEILRRAKTEFDSGRIVTALSILEDMEKFYPMDDEALWLYAQLLEANSPARDIRLALECYQRLIREFPLSFRIPEAQQRINYLQRYYFNIR